MNKFPAYLHVIGYIKSSKYDFDPFISTKGLKQECCIAPILFKIYLREASKILQLKYQGMEISIEDKISTRTILQ